MAVLLDNASATGNRVYWQDPGRAMFRVEGTFDGATVKLQFANANGTFTDVDGTALTADGFVLVEIPSGFVKATVTGGTSPSGLYSDLVSF